MLPFKEEELKAKYLDCDMRWKTDTIKVEYFAEDQVVSLTNVFDPDIILDLPTLKHMVEVLDSKAVKILYGKKVK